MSQKTMNIITALMVCFCIAMDLATKEMFEAWGDK